MPHTSLKSFRTDINGLRALAILGVLLFHFNVPGIPGGFVGVDIFYTISGYLMMQIISTKLANETFSFKGFYTARARRIVPALAALGLVLMVFGGFCLVPSEYATLGHQLTGAFGFYSNFLLSQGSGYFADDATTEWLHHTWSLSVEWQFYLFFPLLIVAGSKYAKGRYLNHVLWGVTILSLVLCIALTPLEPKASFYLIHTRAWELLAGALIYHHPHALRPHSLQVYAGLALILATVVFLPKTATFPGAWPLIPVLGTILILHAAHNTRLLSNPLCQGLGILSYSLYLWHWPILIGAHYLYPANYQTTIAAITLSFLASILSYAYIEKPFRKPQSRRFYLTAILIYVALIASALTIWKTHGFPNRMPQTLRATITENENLINQWNYPRTCDNYKRNPAKKPFTYCTLGSTTPSSTILFWGDSHIEHLYPALQTLGTEATTQNTQLLIGTSAGCPPVRHLNRTEPHYTCESFNNMLFARARQSDISAVVIGAFWSKYLTTNNTLTTTGNTSHPLTVSEALTTLQTGLERDVTALMATGHKVYLLQPTPSYLSPVSTDIAKSLYGYAHTPFTVTKVTENLSIRTMLQTVATNTGATLLDATATFCPQGFPTCIYQHNNVSLYKDANHLNAHGAALLLPLLRQPLTDRKN